MTAGRQILPLMALALVGVLLCGCIGGCGDDDPPNGDSTPPTVQSTNPVDGATGVATDATISATFSEPIDTSTVSGATFALNGDVTGTYSFSGNTVTLTPSADLQYGFNYTALITTGVTDSAANAMRHDRTWSFTTEVDPAVVPPVVVATTPDHNASSASATDPISIAFDKAMLASSFTTDAIALSPAASGDISVADSIVTFSPDRTLEYSTRYTVTVDTVVSDTFGNRLAQPYLFNFTTEVDPLIPVAYILHPQAAAIIGDTTDVDVSTGHPVGVVRVEYWVDSALVHADSSAPFEFAWDATGFEIASTHSLHVVAYDAEGRAGSSDTVAVTYLWEKLVPGVDGNDPWPTDIKWAFARSTDSVLEMRWEFWEDWYDPYDTIPDDTTLDLAVYFDTDYNLSTGRAYFATFEHPLNGIGADYQTIIGLHGNKAINQFSPSADSFVTLHGADGFQYLSLPADTNVLQVGIRWSDLGSPTDVRLVGINVIFTNSNNPGEFIPDWYPDEGAGYITYSRDSRWVGDPVAPERSTAAPGVIPPIPVRTNPFGGAKSVGYER